MYLLICPCIKNPNLRALGITHKRDLDAFNKLLLRCEKFGISTIFLPCPETLYLGPDHEPGHFLNRLDTLQFSSLLKELENKVRKKFIIDGYPFAIIGVDSSPVCGVNYTYYGSCNGSPPKISKRGAFLSAFRDIPAFDVYDAGCFRVYLAAPLFTEAETEYNKKIANILTGYAMEVYLPQESGDSAHTRDESSQNEIFHKNLEAIDNADIIISIIDGADADSGTSWEIGYAYAKGKKIISLRTDFRRVGDNEAINLILEQSSVVVYDIPSLIQALPCPLPLKPENTMV